MSGHWRTLHDTALVVDSACPLLVVPEYVDWYREGGVDLVAPTVGSYFPASAAIDLIGKWLAYIRERPDLALISTAADARAAKAAGRTGVVFHFQGTDPIGEKLDLVDVFKRLGVGIMQLTYNVENAVGYGAQVDDYGLKPFGVEFVRRCNAAGVVVDCSHTGHATSMAAVEASEAPVVLSHTNARALHRTETARNVTDELAAAVGESGGVIGVTGFPGFLVAGGQPTLDDYFDHIDHFRVRGRRPPCRARHRLLPRPASHCGPRAGAAKLPARGGVRALVGRGLPTAAASIPHGHRDAQDTS